MKLRLGLDDSSKYADLLPDGNEILVANRNVKYGFGFAIIYIDVLRVQNESHVNFTAFEHTAVILLNIKSTVQLIGLYRPPELKFACDFTNDLKTLLEKYNVSPHNTFIAGDFNIHYIDHIEEFTEALSLTLDAFNLKQHVTEPTHIKGNTVDLTFAPDGCNVRVKVTDYHISNHFLVTASMPLQHAITSFANYSIYRAFKNIVIDDFCTDLTATEMFLSSISH